MSLAVHLVSDLDGTWISDAHDPDGLRDLESFLAEQPGIVLTFATGRTLPSALAVLSLTARVMPRHLVTDVGAVIHHQGEAGTWVEDGDYARWVDSRWDQGLAEKLAWGTLGPWVRPQASVLARRRLALQAAEGVELDRAVRELARSLKRAGLLADVLASSDRYLDVLPKGVHKGTAVQHLRAGGKLPSPVVVCGDSENDLGMLRMADIPVIMPDGPLSARCPGVPRDRLIVAPSPGPRGILEVLRGLASPNRRGSPGGAA